MTRVWLETDLAGKLHWLAGQPGLRRLEVPAGLTSREALLPFLQREQLGYREAELAAEREALASLARQEHAAANAQMPEFDDRSDEPVELSSPYLPLLRQQRDDIEKRIAAHQAALRAVETPAWRASIEAALDQYEIVEQGTGSVTAAGEPPIVAELTTNSYGLLDDPEARRAWRRTLRGEPDPEEDASDADNS